MEEDKKQFNLVDFQRQFNHLVEENQRLEYIKKKYIEYGKKAKDLGDIARKLADDLDQLSYLIDPVQVLEKTRKSKTDFTSMKEELMQKMREGVQLTPEFVEKTYSLEKQKVYAIWAAIKKYPGVEVIRDGKKSRMMIK